MAPWTQPRQAKRIPLIDDTTRGSVDEDLDSIHIGFKHQRAVHRWRGVAYAQSVGQIRQQHIGIEAAAVRCRVLLSLSGFTHVAAHVLGKFIGGDDAIARLVRFPLETLHDIVRKDSVAAAPLLTLKRAFAITARGE